MKAWPAPPPSRRPPASITAGIGLLVGIDRAGQRHQNCRPADDASSATVEAPDRAITRWLFDHALGQIVEKGLELHIDLDVAIGLGDPIEVLGPALLGTISRDLIGSRASAAIAGGTSSEKARAPWLPPKTSSRSGPLP